MIAYTSICTNYLPKALVLAQSFKQHHPEGKFVIGLVEREYPAGVAIPPCVDRVVLARDLGLENFDQFIFKHDIVEASTAIKASLLKKLYQDYPAENELIYLDPDIKVFGRFVELLDILKEHHLVLTPHISEPEETPPSIIDNELCSLRHGVYNLGFVAVSRCPETERFIRWWGMRLQLFCYNDIANGVFTDQKWLDLAPCFFQAHILKHPGYNFAPWNLSRRKLVRGGQGEYLVNGQPLRFYHFSGFDSGGQAMMIDRYVRDPDSPVHQLKAEYLQDIARMGQERLGKTPWSYSCFYSGEAIQKKARILFRHDEHLQKTTPDPFRLANEDFASEPFTWKKVVPHLLSGLWKTVVRKSA